MSPPSTCFRTCFCSTESNHRTLSIVKSAPVYPHLGLQWHLRTYSTNSPKKKKRVQKDPKADRTAVNGPDEKLPTRTPGRQPTPKVASNNTIEKAPRLKEGTKHKNVPKILEVMMRPRPKDGNTRHPIFVDPLNPPTSTLPAPLVFPHETDFNKKWRYWYACGKCYFAFYKTGVKNLWENRKILKSLGDEPDILVALMRSTRPLARSPRWQFKGELSRPDEPLAINQTNLVVSRPFDFECQSVASADAVLSRSHEFRVLERAGTWTMQFYVGEWVVPLRDNKDYKDLPKKEIISDDISPASVVLSTVKDKDGWVDKWAKWKVQMPQRWPERDFEPDALPGRKYTRAEFQFRHRTRRDVRKMVPFAVILLVLGEWTPLIVAFLSPIIPRNCWLPSQERSKQKKVESTLDYLHHQDWICNPLKTNKSTRTTNSERLPVLLRWLLSGNRSAYYFAKPLYASDIFADLYTGPFKVWFLNKKLRYLDVDDALIRIDGGFESLSEAELLLAAKERGIKVLDRDLKSILMDLIYWDQHGGWRSLMNWSRWWPHKK